MLALLKAGGAGLVLFQLQIGQAPHGFSARGGVLWKVEQLLVVFHRAVGVAGDTFGFKHRYGGRLFQLLAAGLANLFSFVNPWGGASGQQQ